MPVPTSNAELVTVSLHAGDSEDRDRLVWGFLLSKANILRYSELKDTYGLGCIVFIPFPVVTKRNKKAIATTLNRFKQDLISSRVKSNPLYNNISLTLRERFRTHFYDLSASMRTALADYSLFHCPPGFEDPTFFTGDKLLASMISHESTLALYVTASERNELLALGVPLNEQASLQ